MITIITSIISDCEHVSGMGGMLVCCCLQPCRLERPFRGRVGWCIRSGSPGRSFRFSLVSSYSECCESHTLRFQVYSSGVFTFFLSLLRGRKTGV